MLGVAVFVVGDVLRPNNVFAATELTVQTREMVVSIQGLLTDLASTHLLRTLSLHPPSYALCECVRCGRARAREERLT